MKRKWETVDANTNTAQHLSYMSHFPFHFEHGEHAVPNSTPSPAPSRYNLPIEPDENQESIVMGAGI